MRDSLFTHVLVRYQNRCPESERFGLPSSQSESDRTSTPGAIYSESVRAGLFRTEDKAAHSMTCQSGFRRVDMAGSIAVRSRKEEVWGRSGGL
jgi:hypothetical protein